MYPDWHTEGNGKVAGTVARGEAEEDGTFDLLQDIHNHLAQETAAPNRPDDFPGESKSFGRSSGHPLRDDDLETFVARWVASPFLDEATLDFATALVREERLGSGSSPDLLAISLSAMDYVGHLYGPYSHEARDVLRRIDLALGRFLDFLEVELGPNAALVVLTSDHGELCGAHGMRGKGTTAYREQNHVPLIISHPDLHGDKRCQAVTSHLDLVPTIINMAHGEAEKKARLTKKLNGKYRRFIRRMKSR